MRTQLNALKAQEAEIRMGLNIFKIDQPPSHVILLLEKVRERLGLELVHVHVHDTMYSRCEGSMCVSVHVSVYGCTCVSVHVCHV